MMIRERTLVAVPNSQLKQHKTVPGVNWPIIITNCRFTYTMVHAKPTKKSSNRINVNAWHEQRSNHQILGAINSNNKGTHGTSTKTYFSTHSDRPARLKARQEVEDLAPIQHMCNAIENENLCFAIL